jgi:hypothetical protein
MLPALHQPSCRLIQKGIPYANDKYTISLERGVQPVSGGKSKFVLPVISPGRDEAADIEFSVTKPHLPV